MMKILHVYAGNLFGGIEMFLVNLAQWQRLIPDWEHQFALCFPGLLRQRLQTLGTTLYDLGTVRISQPWTVVRARQQLRQILHSQGIDRVICHACWAQAIFGPVAKACHRPLLFWGHDVVHGHHWLERWARWTPPDRVIANSQFTRQSLHHFYTNVPIEVLHLPLSPPQHKTSPEPPQDNATARQQLRQQAQVSPETIVIILTARLERWKGWHDLIKALAELPAIPPWQCWLVGGVQRPAEQAYWNELQKQVKYLSLQERVKFWGQRQDVPQLLAAADLYCQPNTAPEPFGVALVEALYAGLPVVTSAWGGPLEIVTPDCGILVPPHNPAELAKALTMLLTNPNQRYQLARHAPDRARALCEPNQQLQRLYQILQLWS